MGQLLDLTWWLSSLPQSLPWLIACLVVSVLAWPVCLVFFRGLPDRGAALAPAAGVILLVFLAWLPGLAWFLDDGRAALVRLVVLGMGGGLLAGGMLLSARSGPGGARRPRVLLVPAGCLLAVGIVKLPHGLPSALAALVILGALAFAWWGHRPAELRRQLRFGAVSFATSLLLFCAGFFFFANVRSHIPWATFDISLYAAEKWGNFSHLQAVMEARTLPPADPWFMGEPLNYYYGGHLLTATLAKLTATPARVAFNLGLATIFGLTLSAGFAFTMALVHRFGGRRSLPGGVLFQRGLLWGVMGALAIGTFGNLDSWRQLFTRDVDWGVRQRLERANLAEREAWKLRHGLPADTALALWGAVAQGEPHIRFQSLHTTVERLRATAGDPRRVVLSAAEQVEEKVARLEGEAPRSQRRIADELYAVALSTGVQSATRELTSVDGVALQEAVARRLVRGEFAAIAPLLREAAEQSGDPWEGLEPLADGLAAHRQEALRGEAITRLQDFLEMLAQERQPVEPSPLRRAALDARVRLGNAVRDFSYTDAARELLTLRELAVSGAPTRPREDAPLVSHIRASSEPFLREPEPLLRRLVGPPPPAAPGQPSIGDIRFTWENVTQIDFWASSRVVKGSPPGVREAGTITEFPYFSAILGDHHPHHFAIPWFLLALCACLSLLRRTARLGSTDGQFLAIAWPELVAMAFAIGAVFPVNIWDAVVLAPVYAVVILIARRGVKPAEWWRWVGFVGFLLLLVLAVGLIHNSMPARAPLFQNFKFLLLAIAAIVPGIAVVRWLLPGAPSWMTAGGCFAAAAAFILLGTALAPGEGGEAPVGFLILAIRDISVLVVLGGIAASWTLLGPSPSIHRWWYSAGAVYACVGIGALLVTLPFRLWFTSPLQPELEMFAEILPPVLSQEITSAPGAFWNHFWRSSPINPFDRWLRTELRDYFMHWGLFLVPILILLVARFCGAARRVPKGLAFMVAMLAVGLAGFGRNYLGYWAGAISLALIPPCLFLAMVNRRRIDGPAWGFLAVGFFWMWFVEALHFDDDYSGYLERYNTLFKIYYPIWPIFAGAMVLALKEGFGRFRVRERSAGELLSSPSAWVLAAMAGVVLPWLMAGRVPPSALGVYLTVAWLVILLTMAGVAVAAHRGNEGGWPSLATAAANSIMARWPAVVVCLAVLVVGMLYPLAATATRTRELGTHPIVGSWEWNQPQRQIYFTRTLDALDHLQYYDAYRQDYKAMNWLANNAPRGARVLEHAEEGAYTHAGRINTGAGLQSIISWKHHQHQWRGRAKAAPRHLKEKYLDDIPPPADLTPLFHQAVPGLTATVPNDVQTDLRLAGDSERLIILRALFPGAMLEELYRLRRVVARHDITMNDVMGVMFRHVNEMYDVTDRERAAGLMARYGIDYVVVGDLERRAHGAAIGDTLAEWGFEKVFDSSGEEHRLPFDEARIDNPTLVYRVPADFIANARGGGND